MKKKKQHLVPRCYLEAWTTEEVPEEHRGNPKFVPGVWTTSRNLDCRWEHRHPSNMLHSSYFYNIPGDEPDAPLVEEYLSITEKEIPRIREELGRQHLPKWDDQVTIALFVAALSIRTKVQQEHWESQLGKMRDLYRKVGGYFEDEPTGDDLADSKPRDVARKLILKRPLAELLVDQGMHFIFNRSDELLITSDNPVFHQQWHVDDVDQHFPGLARQNVARNRTYPTTIVPLSPRYALISSSLIDAHPQESLGLAVDSPGVITWFNILALCNADSVIVSAHPRVSSGDDAGLRRGVQEFVRSWEEGSFLRIYTKTTRYLLRVETLTMDKARLSFRPSDLGEFERLVADGELEHVEILESGRITGEMRQIEFYRVDPSGVEPSTIRHSRGLDAIFSRD